MLMPKHVICEPWEALRAAVDERKQRWAAEATPDEDRALVKRLLDQVGAWESQHASATRRAEDAEETLRLLRQNARDVAGMLGWYVD